MTSNDLLVHPWFTYVCYDTELLIPGTGCPPAYTRHDSSHQQAAPPQTAIDVNDKPDFNAANHQ